MLPLKGKKTNGNASGTVMVHIYGACDLQLVSQTGPNDPHVVVTSPTQTRHARNYNKFFPEKNSTVTWDKKLTFADIPITEIEGNLFAKQDVVLTFAIMDENEEGENETCIGRVILPLSNFVRGNLTRAWHTLVGVSRGKLELGIQPIDFGTVVLPKIFRPPDPVSSASSSSSSSPRTSPTSPRNSPTSPELQISIDNTVNQINSALSDKSGNTKNLLFKSDYEKKYFYNIDFALAPEHSEFDEIRHFKSGEVRRVAELAKGSFGCVHKGKIKLEKKEKGKEEGKEERGSEKRDKKGEKSEKRDKKDEKTNFPVSASSDKEKKKDDIKEKKVAVKDVSVDCEDAMAEWKKEIELMGMNRSRYVVNIVGYSYSNETLTIVMDFMKRGSLYKVLHEDSDTQLSLIHRLRMARDCLRGLLFLHSNGVMHRDIKSPNVLVAGDFSCKLSDFGCARMTHVDDTLVGRVGTPIWMAPEVKGHKEYSYSADVYSMAIVLYEIFTELPVYDKNSRRVVLQKEFMLAPIVNPCLSENPSDRPSLSAISHSVDEWLTNILSSLLLLFPLELKEKFLVPLAINSSEDLPLQKLYANLVSLSPKKLDQVLTQHLTVIPPPLLLKDPNLATISTNSLQASVPTSSSRSRRNSVNSAGSIPVTDSSPQEILKSGNSALAKSDNISIQKKVKSPTKQRSPSPSPSSSPSIPSPLLYTSSPNSGSNSPTQSPAISSQSVPLIVEEPPTPSTSNSKSPGTRRRNISSKRSPKKKTSVDYVAKANVRVSRESSNSEIPNHSSSSPPSPAPSPSSLSSGALPPGEDISTIHENEEFTAELTRIAQLSAADFIKEINSPRKIMRSKKSTGKLNEIVNEHDGNVGEEGEAEKSDGKNLAKFMVLARNPNENKRKSDKPPKKSKLSSSDKTTGAEQDSKRKSTVITSSIGKLADDVDILIDDTGNVSIRYSSSSSSLASPSPYPSPAPSSSTFSTSSKPLSTAKTMRRSRSVTPSYHQHHKKSQKNSNFHQNNQEGDDEENRQEHKHVSVPVPKNSGGKSRKRNNS